MADRLEIAFVVSGLTATAAALSQTANAAGGVGGPAHGAALAGSMNSFLSALGTISPAASAATQAVKLLIDAMAALAVVTETTFSQFQAAQIAMNSTSRETLTLGVMGRAFGIDAAASAAALRQQANFSTLGRVSAAGLGIPFQPYDIGSAQNEGRVLLDAIREARRMFREDPQKLAVVFRNLPELQKWAGVITAQKELVPLMERNVKAWEAVFTPQNVETVTEFKLQLSMAEANMLALAAAIGGPLLRAVNKVLDKMASPVGTPFSTAFAPTMADRAGMSHEAQTAHTAAVRENTEAIRAFSGTFGGGRRAHSAVPGAFSGNMSAERDGGWAALKGSASRLGAYSIGM